MKVPKKRVKNYIGLINLLNKSNSKKKEIILKHLNDKSIDFICELVHNVIHNNFNLSSKKVRKIKTLLHPNKKSFRYLSKKSGRIDKKRKLMVQHGQGIGVILSTVLPILLNVLSNYASSTK